MFLRVWAMGFYWGEASLWLLCCRALNGGVELNPVSTQDLWAEPVTIRSSFMSLSKTLFPRWLSLIGHPVLAIFLPGMLRSCQGACTDSDLAVRQWVWHLDASVLAVLCWFKSLCVPSRSDWGTPAIMDPRSTSPELKIWSMTMLKGQMMECVNTYNNLGSVNDSTTMNKAVFSYWPNHVDLDLLGFYSVICVILTVQMGSQFYTVSRGNHPRELKAADEPVFLSCCPLLHR